MRRLSVDLSKALLPVVLALCVVTGCDAPPPDPAMDTSRPEDFGFQRSTKASLLSQGKEAYEQYCVGCHGVNGDGRGEAAGFLDPRPRNFQTAEFKFNSRGVGELPTDDDLKRTIRYGLKGSAMPAFRLLGDRTLESLVAYIKTFSPRWEEETPGQPIQYVEDPWRMDEDKSEAIQRGEVVYHGYASCWSCHPAYVTPEKIDEYLVMMGDDPRGEYRDDIHKAIGKATEEGNILYPPDFRRDFVRSGMSLEDLYRSIGAGIQGSAMPKWLMSIEYQPDENEPPLTTKADIWAMAYYVQDLIRQRPAKLEAGSFDVRSRAQTIHVDGLPETTAQEDGADTMIEDEGEWETEEGEWDDGGEGEEADWGDEADWPDEDEEDWGDEETSSEADADPDAESATTERDDTESGDGEEGAP